MKLISALCASLTVVLAGCATGAPSSMTLSDPQNRHLNGEVAMTDGGTASRCAENMLNASPANEAVDVKTQIMGSGQNVVVDVAATLMMRGEFAQPLHVTYRCTYVNGSMTHSTWTSGLKGG